MTAYFNHLDEYPLEISLLAAVVLHVAVIFGIQFEKPEALALPPPDQIIEIMIVQNAQPAKEPEQTDFLAQIDQQGSGNPQEITAPTTESVETPPLPEAVEAAVPDPLPALQPVPEPASIPEPEPVSEPEPSTAPEPQQEPASAPPRVAPVVEPEAKAHVSEIPPEPEVEVQPRPPEPAQDNPPKPTRPKRKSISAADLLRSTEKEIALLTAEIGKKTLAAANGPRRKFISARTTEYKYASYMDGWRRKVERIGNLNYPEQAKRKKIFGNLILTVGIHPDGSIERVQIDRSSGYQLLDQAAENIVRLSAPFPRLPPNISSEADILYITRTWHFRETNELTSK